VHRKVPAGFGGRLRGKGPHPHQVRDLAAQPILLRLLLASGCLPERAGQPAQVQLHLGLDELLSMPGAAQAARAWLEDHLGTPPASAADPPGADPSAGEPGGADPSGGEPGVGDPSGGEPGVGDPLAGEPSGGGGPGPGSARPGAGSPFWPDPQDLFSWPDPRAARRFAAGAGETGWLTGKAAEAYSCDAKIAPMVCGHLDRNALARAVTALLAGDLANLATPTDPAPATGPRCACDEHPPEPRAAMPGALPRAGLPGQPPATGPDSLTPGGLARLQDTLLRYAVSLLSGPAGLAAYLRTQLTGGFFPSASLPLDLGEPTEQVPPHLRRAVTKRDRHCSFPGCTAPPVRCHVHHVIPRSQGGPTRLDNLTLLCTLCRDRHNSHYADVVVMPMLLALRGVWAGW
jgi:HNH endonuclease